jgi:hypothetical protein
MPPASAAAEIPVTTRAGTPVRGVKTAAEREDPQDAEKGAVGKHALRCRCVTITTATVASVRAREGHCNVTAVFRTAPDQ